MIVYRLISPSGKSYIGKTSKLLLERLSTHTGVWKYYKNRWGQRKLWNAFDKYGPPILKDKSINQNWVSEVLVILDDEIEINLKEQHFIELFDSIKTGYNSLPGGAGRPSKRGFSSFKPAVAPNKIYGNRKGKTYEEFYGIERSLEIKEKLKMARGKQKGTKKISSDYATANYKRWADPNYRKRVSLAMRKPKKSTKNMGRYIRTLETREKLRQAALEQWKRIVEEPFKTCQ